MTDDLISRAAAIHAVCAVEAPQGYEGDMLKAIRALPAVAASQTNMDSIDRSDIDRVISALRSIHGSDLDNKAADLIHSLTEALAEAYILAASQPNDPAVKPNSCQQMRVKPLVWERHPMGWIAGAAFGPSYIIDVRIKGRVMFIKGINPSPQLDDIEAAKAAAQADYEKRILAAIETHPNPRDAVIAQLVDGISFYADWDNWVLDERGVSLIDQDEGKLARAAIAAAKGGDA